MSFWVGSIGASAYAYPSLGWGWGMPSAIPSPLSFAPYSYYGPAVGGRTFYGSYFSPSFGGVPFSPWGLGNYSYDVMDAGFRLLGWGNILEAEPFYRYYNPWFFGPVIPPLYWPVPPLVPYPPTQASAPQAAPATQTSEGQNTLTEQARDIERREKELQEKAKSEEERIEKLAQERDEEFQERVREAEAQLGQPGRSKKGKKDEGIRAHKT